LDEWVALVRFLEFLKRRLVVSRIECDVALQVRKELCLLGIGSLVEDVLRRSDVLLRLRSMASCSFARSTSGRLCKLISNTSVATPSGRKSLISSIITRHEISLDGIRGMVSLAKIQNE
jgi:hypothetical protein